MVWKVSEPECPKLIADLFLHRIAMLVQGLKVTEDAYEFLTCDTQSIGVHGLSRASRLAAATAIPLRRASQVRITSSTVGAMYDR
jgi:hypothetical protein